MADQLIFDDLLTLDALGGTTRLSGAIVVDYSGTPSVTGSLTVDAFGVLGAQTFQNIQILQNGVDAGGNPRYILTGTNGTTKLSIAYVGMAPSAADATLTDNASVALAGATAAPVLASIVCFAEGTVIRTQRGDVPIERLRVGDDVVTASGKRRTIRWLGVRKLDCRNHADPRTVWPIRIAADAFGPRVPSRDLYVSPGHAILVQVVDEVLVPAGLLVNGATIDQVEVDEITYWHLELADHDIVVANNLRAESYIDVGNRAFFGNRGEDPDGARETAGLAHYCRPYVTDEAVVAAVRGRTQTRASTLGWTLGGDPMADVRLVVDGKELRPRLRGTIATFTVPRDPRRVWLRSQTAVPAMIGLTPDLRRLGVCLKSVAIDGRRLAADDPSLCVGFHPAEGTGSTLCRWTNGRALLPADLVRGGGEIEIEIAGPALPRWVAPSDAPRAAA